MAKRGSSLKGRKKCVEGGCRKFQIAGERFCEYHANDAPERAAKVSEMDALRFGKLDAEMRNHLGGMRIADLELERLDRQMDKAKTDYVNTKTQLVSQKRALQGLVDQLKPEYDSLVNRIAEEHGIESPKSMSIDPETRVVRDLSKT